MRNLIPQQDGGDNGSPNSKHKRTALVVDDCSDIRLLLTRQLLALGYNVLSAADGAEARELARAADGNGIDLLITDRSMPRLTGDELVRWFRQEKPETQIIIMSTHGDGLPDHAAFLQKPFTLTSLHDALSEISQCADFLKQTAS